MADTTENPNEETIKCVVVGDNNVGKTRLICARAYNKQSHNNRCILGNSHVPTVWAIDQYRNNDEVLQNARCTVDGTLVSLRLWDTFGDHHKDRRFAYGKADVVVICYSVCDKKSLQQVQRFWVPEVRKHCKTIPIILVACKVDLRFADLGKLKIARGSKIIRSGDILYPDQCRSIIEMLNCPYYETSVLLSFGIHDVFENVCRAALLYRRSLYFWNTGLKRVLRPVVQEPLAPPRPESPHLNMSSTNCSVLPELTCLYDNQVFVDVTFICQEKKLRAHKVILSSASDSLYRLLSLERGSNNSTSMETRSSETGMRFTSSLREGEELVTSDDERTDRRKTRLSDDFKPHSDPVMKYHEKDENNCDIFSVNLPWTVFEIIVKFCYTGKLVLAYQNLNEASVIDLLTRVIVASKHFGLLDLVQLATQCVNADSNAESDELTQHFLMRRSHKLQELFLDQKRFADVVFKVDDGVVYAHKVVLCAGCDVMNAMLSGSFVESENKEIVLQLATTQSLKVMFEHIYASNVTELSECSDGDLLDVLQLADRFCLSQLVAQVEVFAVDLIKTREAKFFETNDKQIMSILCEDVLLYMEMSGMYHASRLCEWCLHFLCVHYNEACWSVSKLMKNLPAETQKYLSQHRWPPVWYIKQRDAYEKMIAQRKVEDSTRLVRKTKK